MTGRGWRLQGLGHSRDVANLGAAVHAVSKASGASRVAQMKGPRTNPTAAAVAKGTLIGGRTSQMKTMIREMDSDPNAAIDSLDEELHEFFDVLDGLLASNQSGHQQPEDVPEDFLQTAEEYISGDWTDDIDDDVRDKLLSRAEACMVAVEAGALEGQMAGGHSSLLSGLVFTITKMMQVDMDSVENSSRLELVRSALALFKSFQLYKDSIHVVVPGSGIFSGSILIYHISGLVIIKDKMILSLSIQDIKRVCHKRWRGQKLSDSDDLAPRAMQPLRYVELLEMMITVYRRLDSRKKARFMYRVKKLIGVVKARALGHHLYKPEAQQAAESQFQEEFGEGIFNWISQLPPEAEMGGYNVGLAKSMKGICIAGSSATQLAGSWLQKVMSDVKGTGAGFAEQDGRVVLIILAALHRKVDDRMHDCYEVAPGAPPSVIAAAGKLEVLDLSAADAHFREVHSYSHGGDGAVIQTIEAFLGYSTEVLMSRDVSYSSVPKLRSWFQKIVSKHENKESQRAVLDDAYIPKKIKIRVTLHLRGQTGWMDTRL